MIHQKVSISTFIFISFSFVLGAFGIVGLAQTSPNFSLGDGFGNGGGQSISGNFVQNCNQISGGAAGQGNSANYSVTSGVKCDTSQLSLNFRAAPEKRVPNPGLNLAQDNTQLQIFSVGNPNSVYTSPSTLSLDNDGNSTATITAPIAAGQYDISVKTSQHLSKRNSNISLNSGTNTVDLTNSLTNYLKAGDVNNAGGLGDNTVNALDISKEINQLGGSDGQTDLNRDTKVNALDIGILLKNLGQTGD